MLTLRCTAKLFNEVGIKKSDLIVALETESDWYAHIFYFNKKKCLIFVHTKTLFTFILTDLKRENIRHIDLVFNQGLKHTLRIEGFPDDEISRILSVGESIKYAKTINRAVIGSMNDLIFQFKAMIEYNYAEGHMTLEDIVKEMNRIPMSYIDGFAIERFCEQFCLKETKAEERCQKQ